MSWKRQKQLFGPRLIKKHINNPLEDEYLEKTVTAEEKKTMILTTHAAMPKFYSGVSLWYFLKKNTAPGTI